LMPMDLGTCIDVISEESVGLIGELMLPALFLSPNMLADKLELIADDWLLLLSKLLVPYNSIHKFLGTLE
jgi:hypothetical protein